MRATVTKNDMGTVEVLVRRGYRVERLFDYAIALGFQPVRLDRLHPELKVGQVVEVKRQTNNPYLVLVCFCYRENCQEDLLPGDTCYLCHATREEDAHV